MGENPPRPVTSSSPPHGGKSFFPLDHVHGNPQKNATLFPLTDLLVVPLSGLGGRSLLPNGGPEIFIVADPEKGKERLAQHRLLL